MRSLTKLQSEDPMAIQPIDLQTLFSQMEKVAKIQTREREGAQIQASLQGVQIQKKTDEKAHSVNETKDAGEGAEGINDKDPRKKREQASDAKQGETPDETEAEGFSIIRDPDLGRNIDLSG
jgi:hypothetical protein